MNKIKLSVLAASVCTSLFLGACGEDSSTGLNSGDKVTSETSVETIYDLGKCSSERKGEIIFVEENDSDYLCDGNNWKNLGTPESSDSKDISSNSKDDSSTSKDESSDSKNDVSSTDKSSDSKDDLSSASKDENTSVDKSSDSKEVSSSSKDDASETPGSSSSSVVNSSSVVESSSSVRGQNEVVADVAVSKQTFTGVAQKGPFTAGSVVKLSELDEVLDLTGTSFEWEVTTDQGEYTSSKVTLRSQYALMQVSGFYYNENTGKTSTGQLTLKSMVDLNERKSANVNILGHLTHKRIVNLFAESGKYKNVPAAKSAAEKEVMNSFHWTVNNHAFEDLNIFGSTEDDAKLLAASILLQGDLSDADFSSRLASLTTDFEDDGVWNDSAARIAVADWAMDTTRSFSKIREKLLEVGPRVPNFEKYIYQFAGIVYDIGVCSENRDGEKVKIKNPYSKNLGQEYVCADGKWRKPTSTEKRLGFACAVKNKGTIVHEGTTNGNLDWYCPGDGNWRLARVYDYPKSNYFNPSKSYGTLKDSRDGKTYKTVKIGTQTWMAENLNYYDKNNANLQKSTWCYEDVEENCEVGGRFYTWAAAMNLDPKYNSNSASAAGVIKIPHQGLCPAGWHIPNTGEFSILREYVVMMEGGGKVDFNDGSGQLKSVLGWHDLKSPFITPRDPYGFSAIPTGAYYGSHRNPDGQFSRYVFDDASYYANYWSASEGKKATGAVYWFLEYGSSTFDYHDAQYNDKDRGYSIRCIID
ncbi:FISUMP domain-containing protein [Fibrobacter sp. HC4]|uniref:FISUMP domain-containing protein n=1 Tax=Fibrobacter sp. HC4 TaxID=3239812 RepID=UPI00201991E8|nr:FISUMP domain-containing protein [Fibrobacter succinogenes]MCL4100704.1 hypothetical protein [Fibrobacter succinogenes]